jgi:hypothetical protein
LTPNTRSRALVLDTDANSTGSYYRYWHRKYR